MWRTFWSEPSRVLAALPSPASSSRPWDHQRTENVTNYLINEILEMIRQMNRDGAVREESCCWALPKEGLGKARECPCDHQKGELHLSSTLAPALALLVAIAKVASRSADTCSLLATTPIVEEGTKERIKKTIGAGLPGIEFERENACCVHTEIGIYFRIYVTSSQLQLLFTIE